MKPIIINIHGSCVSRDLFRGQEDSPLVVGEYIARSTIFSTMAAPVKISDPSFHEKGTWRKRLVQMDCGKKLFDCFREHPSDILLLDGIDERLGVLTFGGGAALTMSPYAQQELPAPVLAGGARVYPWQTNPQVMRKCVQGYARRLLELYRPEQIILYRAFCKEHYRDKEGRIHPFTDWEKYNAVFYRQLNTYLASLYRELEQQLGCRVLCQSGDVMGDEANQWGLSPFHYRQEDYEHVFQSLEELLLPSS